MERKDEICITDSALAKLRLIGRIMGDVEFRLIAVQKRRLTRGAGGCNGQHIIEDFRIPYQQAGGYKVETQGCRILDAEDLLHQEGLIVVGLAHGHGAHPAFYSPDDHRAFDAQLDLIKRDLASVEEHRFSFSKGKVLRQVFLEGNDREIILRSPDDQTLSLHFPKAHYAEEDLLRFARDVSYGRMTSQREIASLVTNRAEDIYCIKRYEEVIPPCILEDAPGLTRYVEDALSEFPEFSSLHGSVVRYSRTAKLVTVAAGEPLAVEERLLREELQEKIVQQGHSLKRDCLKNGRIVSRDVSRTVERTAEDTCGTPVSSLKDPTAEGLQNLLEHYRRGLATKKYVALASDLHGLDSLLACALVEEKKDPFASLRSEYLRKMERMQGRTKMKADLQYCYLMNACSLQDRLRIRRQGQDLASLASDFEKLGNIYLALGNRSRCGKAYHQAGILRGRMHGQV